MIISQIIFSENSKQILLPENVTPLIFVRFDHLDGYGNNICHVGHQKTICAPSCQQGCKMLEPMLLEAQTNLSLALLPRQLIEMHRKLN